MNLLQSEIYMINVNNQKLSCFTEVTLAYTRPESEVLINIVCYMWISDSRISRGLAW